MSENLKRCGWAGDDPRYVAYHDEEWGVPLHDDQQLFEFLILEGAQAGLSWSTILYKRDNYREAFSGFDPARVARFNKRKVESLLKNPGIVRNRLKINSAINNAKIYLEIQDEFGSYNDFMWRFVNGTPKQNRWRSMKNVPASTNISDAFSKELKRRGFKFVGTTICYAFMQATGMVNDHITTCFRHKQVAKLN